MSGFSGNFFRGDLNIISSGLVSFRDSLLFHNHCDRSFSSWFTTDSIVPSFLSGNGRLVSSAKWWIINFENAPCKSLMYTRNNKGPNIEPCGTWVGTISFIKYSTLSQKINLEYQFSSRVDDNKERNYYSLHWTCTFPNENDTYYFAHSYPYTYTDLQVCLRDFSL